MSKNTDPTMADLPDGLPKPRRYYAAATLLAAIAITVLDASMSNVALPTIAKELNIPAASVVWVAIAYSLTIVMTLLPLSAIAERIGLGRMFVAGTSLFLVASLGAAFSQDFTTLITARIAQGLGSSMLMCLFGGLVRNIYPLRRLAMGLSLSAMAVSMTAVLGPSIGAFLLDFASWRWLFFINVPICLLTWFGVRHLPKVPRNSRPFDWYACLLSLPVFGLSILGLDLIASNPLWAIACLLIAFACGWVLIKRSLGQTAPIVPVDLLRITPVAYAVGASAFSFAAQMASVVALPFFFQHVMSYSYTEIGLMLGTWSLGVGVMAPISAWLSGRLSIALMCATGAGAMALGTGLLLLYDVHTPMAFIFGSMVLGGFGFGLFQTPNNRALLAGVPRNRSAAAGGMQATTRVYGQSFGTALVALAFALGHENGPALGVLVATVCAVGSLIINIARHRNPASDPQF